MKKNRIFLSYRRDDSPGYVSRLEEELEREFGDGRVFRDATDIPGGTKWKNVIDSNLHNSAVLLLVIGPRWEQIWHERINDEMNYVALELQRAHDLDVPIFPITLDGTQLSKELDLGPISFIYENQFHDISDKQGRWRGDFKQLVNLLETVPGMGPARNSSGSAESAELPDTGGKSRFKKLAVVASLLIVAAVWLGMDNEVDDAGANPGAHKPTDQANVVLDNTNVSNNVNSSASTNFSPIVDSSTSTSIKTSASHNVDTRSNIQLPEPVIAVPDINGTWQGRDGTIYFVEQYNDGTFEVESPGYTSGQGRFFTNMPGKFEVEMYGVGRGEFSVSTTGDRAMGWIVVDGRQEFDTLTRVE